MTFAAPIWLALAAAAAVGVLVAHLFARSVPSRDRLPTTRFIPEDAPLAVLRTNRLSDWLLLLLRLAVCALIGLALSGAHVPKRAPSRVALVDASRAVASAAELRDSLRAYPADRTILFDSTARQAGGDALDSVATSGARGSLSAALVAAHRAMQGFASGRDAVELVIVSPLAREEVDAATLPLLARWEGRVTFVRVGLAAATAGRGGVEVRAEGDDPVAAAFRRDSRALEQPVRVVRTVPTDDDRRWARESGSVLVVWPARPEGVLERLARADTAGAVSTGDVTVVGTFARTHQPRSGRVIARWNDGSAAAAEVPTERGDGCVREVAVRVDPIGDIVLRDAFRDFARVMAAPCGGSRDFARAELPPHAAAAAAPQLALGREPAWFALAALALLLLEYTMRNRRRVAA